ncbi:unnamed protein product, partial [Scytosiphon promiscuus]
CFHRSLRWFSVFAGDVWYENERLPEYVWLGLSQEFRVRSILPALNAFVNARKYRVTTASPCTHEALFFSASRQHSRCLSREIWIDETTQALIHARKPLKFRSPSPRENCFFRLPYATRALSPDP